VRDRQARVDRFETDAACPLFLISLKAGGHGLNLTSAGYVFILDPWWNPAVEAQAIDRAHRIGQTKRVIATRIVARDTIEEKILDLQASKRALAEAILGQDQGVLSQIGPEELRLLLG
jgi:SNF2 family DNA or RNA helicase